MGFFDKVKKGIADVAQQGRTQQQPQQQQAHQPEPEPQHQQVQLDIAGFDPDDEEAFFNAVQHMESEGQFGGTDESRAEICARYGIRDRSHWRTVKDGMYAILAHRYGSIDEVGQREMNWRMGQMQRHMQAQVAKTAAGGGFEPVEGVTLEAWAAMNASIISGTNVDDLLKGAGIDRGRWDRVSAEWNARMARDTTFAITTVYGNAFQAASQGKFNAYAKEAAAARAANRELAMQPPMPYEQYAEIMYEQAYAAKAGKDPVAALEGCGLTIVDWTDLSTFMGYLFHRDGVRNHQMYVDIYKRAEAKVAAKYPGVKADVDIQF